MNPKLNELKGGERRYSTKRGAERDNGVFAMHLIIIVFHGNSREHQKKVVTWLALARAFSDVPQQKI